MEENDQLGTYRVYNV
jgi:hypothetical protein